MGDDTQTFRGHFRARHPDCGWRNVPEVHHFLLSKRRVAARTREFYEQNLGDFFGFAEKLSGDTGLAALTPIMIEEYLNDQAERHAPATVHARFRCLRALCRFLIREEYLSKNPMRSVEAPHVPKRPLPLYQQADIGKMMAWLPKSTWWGCRDRAIVLTFLLTGIRREELARLDWPDVDLAGELLRVVGKGGKERRVWLPAPAAEALLRYQRHRKRDAPALFQAKGGGRLSGNAIYSIVKRLGQRAGVKDVRRLVHTLRHTAALQYLRAGGEMRHLQHLLGHSTLAATQVYVRELADEDAIKQARRVDAFKGWL